MSDRSTSEGTRTWSEIRQQVMLRDDYRCLSCGMTVSSAEADVHHLLPRSMGGGDELSNLVTHHPTLMGGLARRVIERWAIRLAQWLDREGIVAESVSNFGPALRLFGLDRFREGQLPIVLAALAGKSVLVISPTGSGKTLCFQLPALLRNRVSFVVSPLKTLMAAQVSSLLKLKIPSTFINSDLSRSEKDTRFSLLGRGAIKLLYLAPERFFVRSEAERSALKQCRPSFLVVDEAHCVDRWGTDFRREYGRLNEVRQKLGAPPVLAFTATAGKEMQRRILESLGIPDAMVFVRDVDRPNIAMLRWRCQPEQRANEIATMLTLPKLQQQKVMIFVPSARVGEDLAGQLAEQGLNVPLFHSRLGSAWERAELLQRFLGANRPVVNHIICTNAFGMGLDVPNVRLVIHWQQSASVEDMLQEFGRAGRDSKPSVSVIFHDGPGGKDASRLTFMAEKTIEAASMDEASSDTILDLRVHEINQVADMLRSNGCFRKQVRSYFGQDGGDPHGRTLSQRILDWVFSSRSKQLRRTACCDSCDAEWIKKRSLLEYVAANVVG
jgi:ATP-dependent DNA helicase RecQ